MVFKKWCCCLSLRMGSLILLYIYLIDYAWTMLNDLSNVGDRKINTLLSKNVALVYSNLFLSITGVLIFLATIISITKKTHCKSFLIATMSFLIVKTIYGVCVVILLLSNDSIKNFYYEAVDEEALKLIKDPNYREQYVKIMHAEYGSLLTHIYIGTACNIAFVLYSALVFYSYMVEVKENIANDVRLKEKSNPEEGYSCKLPPPYTSQYDTQHSQCFVNV
ncbi:uncharacterized protein LOC135834604 [Planococcus citri]|uniref:uncharacterized protein LOC135834604 n=1 Tax=Planococcus citri TaxID=170843 RepID=UPI0031F84905